MDTPSSILLITSFIFITIAIFLVGKLYLSFLRIPSTFNFETSFQVPLNTSWGLYEVKMSPFIDDEVKSLNFKL